MKQAGIIGGLGPESTVDYYQSFIQKFQEKMDSKQTLSKMATAHQLDGLILGCTELSMIIEEDTELALLNTTAIHVDKMIEATFAE